MDRLNPDRLGIGIADRTSLPEAVMEQTISREGLPRSQIVTLEPVRWFLQMARTSMGKQSAGLLMYRGNGSGLEVLLVHPGGPFWAKKDDGAWTLPKGEPADGEELVQAAQREFTEETGFEARGPFHDLGQITQAGGKKVTAWAFEGDCNPADLKSNLCEIEWPPRSKRTIQVPEIDRGAWFSIPEARKRILSSQIPLLDRLQTKLTPIGSGLLP